MLGLLIVIFLLFEYFLVPIVYLAPMAGDSSNTVSIATSTEPFLLVGNAVSSAHVVLLVPDVSVTLSIGDVG